jgi:hypothetical protein
MRISETDTAPPVSQPAHQKIQGNHSSATTGRPNHQVCGDRLSITPQTWIKISRRGSEGASAFAMFKTQSKTAGKCTQTALNSPEFCPVLRRTMHIPLPSLLPEFQGTGSTFDHNING